MPVIPPYIPILQHPWVVLVFTQSVTASFGNGNVYIVGIISGGYTTSNTNIHKKPKDTGVNTSINGVNRSNTRVICCSESDSVSSAKCQLLS